MSIVASTSVIARDLSALLFSLSGGFGDDSAPARAAALRVACGAEAERSEILAQEASASSRRHEELSSKLDAMSAASGRPSTSRPVMARAAITTRSLAQVEADVYLARSDLVRALEALARVLQRVPLRAAELLECGAEDAIARADETQERASMWSRRLREQRLQLVALAPGINRSALLTPTPSASSSSSSGPMPPTPVAFTLDASSSVRISRNGSVSFRSARADDADALGAEVLAPSALAVSSTPLRAAGRSNVRVSRSGSVVIGGKVARAPSPPLAAAPSNRAVAQRRGFTGDFHAAEPGSAQQREAEHAAAIALPGPARSAAAEAGEHDTETGEHARRMSVSMTKMHAALHESHIDRMALLEEMRSETLPSAWRAQIELRVGLDAVKVECERALRGAQLDWLTSLGDVEAKHVEAEARDRAEIARLKATVQLLRERECASATAAAATLAVGLAESDGAFDAAAQQAGRDALVAAGDAASDELEGEAAELLFSLEATLRKMSERSVPSSIADPLTGEVKRAADAAAAGWGSVDALFMERQLAREAKVTSAAMSGARTVVAQLLARAYRVVDGARAARDSEVVAERKAKEQKLVARAVRRISNCQCAAAWRALVDGTAAIARENAQRVLLMRHVKAWNGRRVDGFFEEWRAKTSEAQHARAVLRRSLLHMRRSNVAAAFRMLRMHGAIGAASMGAQLRRSKTRTAASEATSVAWRAASAATDSAATASMVLAIQVSASCFVLLCPFSRVSYLVFERSPNPSQSPGPRALSDSAPRAAEACAGGGFEQAPAAARAGCSEGRRGQRRRTGSECGRRRHRGACLEFGAAAELYRVRAKRVSRLHVPR